VFAGVGVAALAAIVALAIVITTAGNPQPSFAASLNPNGTVTVTLRELNSIGALNARLAQLGTKIRAVPVLRGCVAPVRVVENGQPVPGPARTLEISPQNPGALVSVSFDVGNLLPGRTFVVAASADGLQGISGVVEGPAPKCVGYGSSATAKPFLILAHK
jgi:hypothetical protein